MALPFVTAKYREFTDNGAPASGYKLYTYEPGTTTNKATYTTADLDVANTNPVVLDSEGRAAVWLSGKYKFVLKTDADVTVWTVDDVGETTTGLAGFTLDDATPTFATASTFTVPTDRTADFIDDLRLKLTDATTLYGRITAQTYAAGPDTTTVTVALDSGSLSGSLTAVYVGVGDVGKPIHAAHVATDASNVESELADKLPLAGGTMTGDIACGDNQVLRPKIKDYSEVVAVNATATGAVTLDLENGNYHKCTLTGNVTFTFSNPSASGTACNLTVKCIQDGTGSRTITWPASVDWAGGTAPAESTGANDVDMFTFVTDDGGTTWLGSLWGADFA